MRLVALFVVAVALSIFGFSVALVHAEPRSEADQIMAINRAHDAGDVFAKAWNDWARKHDRFKTNTEDRTRFKTVRKAWKDFDRLCREIEY